MTPTHLLQTDAFLESIIGQEYLGEEGTSTCSGIIDTILTQSIGEGWRESYSDLVTLMNELACLCSTGTGGDEYSLSEYNKCTKELLQALTDRELFSPTSGRPLAPHAHTYLNALFGLGWETDLRPLRALAFRTAEYFQFLKTKRDPESSRGFPFGIRWGRADTSFPVSCEQIEAFIDALSGEDCVINRSPQRLSSGLYDLVCEELGVDWENRTEDLGELLWRTAEDLHLIALGDPSETIHNKEWALRFYEVIIGEETHEIPNSSDDHFDIGSSPHLFTHLTAVLGVGWNVPSRNIAGEMRNKDRVRMRLQAFAGYLLKVSAVLAESKIPEVLSDEYIDMPTANREQALAFYEALTCQVNLENGRCCRRSPHAYTHISALLGAAWEFAPLQVRTFLNPSDIRDPQHSELRRMLDRLSAYLRAVAEQLDPDIPRPDQVRLKQRGLIFPTEASSGSFLLTYNQAAAFYLSLSGIEHLNEHQARRKSSHTYTHLAALLGSEWELDTFELSLLKDHSTLKTPIPSYLEHSVLYGKLQRFVHHIRSVAWQLDPEIQGRLEAYETQYGIWSKQEEKSI